MHIALQFIPQSGWQLTVWILHMNDESSDKCGMLGLFFFYFYFYLLAADTNQGCHTVRICRPDREDTWKTVPAPSGLVINVFCCLSVFVSRVTFSFSRGLRCRLRGPPSQQTRPPYGLDHRLPRQPSTLLTNQSWWPWRPCLSLPHRLHHTTSHRWD